MFVCGISLTSSQLFNEFFPGCTRTYFSQVVSRRRGGDRIYEMRCLFVAVGPNARFITGGDTTAHPPVTSDDTLKPSRGHEDNTEPSELEQATPDGAGTVTKKRVKQAKRQKKKPVKTTTIDQPERLTRRGRLIRVPARLQNSVQHLLHLFN